MAAAACGWMGSAGGDFGVSPDVAGRAHESVAELPQTSDLEGVQSHGDLPISADSTAVSVSVGSALQRCDLHLLAQSLVAQVARLDDETRGQVRRWLARWCSGGEQIHLHTH